MRKIRFLLQGGCLDVEMMLKMKKVILLFALTMKSYGFGIGSLYTLLQNFRYFDVFFLTRFGN